MSLAKRLSGGQVRLALRYGLLFGTAVSLLIGGIYVTTVHALDRQFEAEIMRDVEVLRAIGLKAPGQLESYVRQESEGPWITSAFYLLQAPTGERVAGRIPEQTPQPGWQHLPFPPNPKQDPERQHRLKAFGTLLPDGRFLIVARDKHALNELQEVISRGYALCLVITLGVLGVSGLRGEVRVRGRLADMSAAMHAFASGQLDRRMPVERGNDEVSAVARRINVLLDRLQTLIEELHRVTSDIAHDLRTPLGRIRQRLETVQSGKLGADEADAIEQCSRDLDEVLATFAALLRIAQIEAGERRSGFAEVNLAAVLSNVVEAYEPVAEAHGQLLTASVPHRLVVQGDRGLLNQLFANLVENAIRHCPAGTRIEASADTKSGAPLAIVADNGPGIPPAMREAVFRRFFRLDRSRSTPGNGLGLSLVAAIADLHEAGVRLDDNNPGLRVEVRFSGSADVAAPLRALQR